MDERRQQVLLLVQEIPVPYKMMNGNEEGSLLACVIP